MKHVSTRGVIAATAFLIVATLAAPIPARTNRPRPPKDGSAPSRVFVLDGSNVHNVGEIQMHLGNWGLFGSHPGSQAAYAEAPSAQWPAGSGTEYLFSAGLWVGALKNGVPAVSTSDPDREFQPSNDTRDVMYRSGEGATGGIRLPSPAADDDRDGRTDEDWLNGHDDDGDLAVDEDFAAVSRQMFTCQYADDEPGSVQEFPNHNPLRLHVRQESYQWDEDRFDDFIGVEFHITNTGTDILEDVYIGFFVDGDVGQRGTENYWEDDASGFVRAGNCGDLGPVLMDIAYVYDVDGDDGQTLGYLGIMFLGHTTDPTGDTAPQRVGIATYNTFSGTASFEDGGDPTNDFQRYELLSSGAIDRNAEVPRDYRVLLAAGPFRELLPESTLVFQTAFVIGERMEGLLKNGEAAQATFQGAWFNIDGDPTTGVAGRETPVHGPAAGVQVDSCLAPNQAPITVQRGQTLWINNDCAREEMLATLCNYSLNDSLKYQTGVGGAEKQVFWIVGTAPPAPNLRVDAAARDGVAVYWDSYSETQPDVKSQIVDFEGFRVYRADNWARPFGTSSRNGPGANLWKLLFEVDVANGFGNDTGLDHLRYEPLTHILPNQTKRDMIETMKEQMLDDPLAPPPCPQGVTEEVCDTLEALAAWELGLKEGRRYYRYVDRNVHTGRPYFYAVTAGDHGIDPNTGALIEGKVGDPASNFVFVEPRTPPQADYNYQEDDVYVVPNPANAASMQPWTLSPNNDDPTGVKVEFRNLPEDRGTVRVFTVAGDLVTELRFDGRTGVGSLEWDLVSRNGQDVASGVYIFAVETDTNAAFKRKIGKFVVIR